MAQFTVSLVVNSPPATKATFVPAPGPFDAPLKPGTVVGTVTVEPPEWAGVLSVAAPFSMTGNQVVVGPTALPMGAYTAAGMAAP